MSRKKRPHYTYPIANIEDMKFFAKLNTIEDAEKHLKDYKPFKNASFYFFDQEWEFFIGDKREILIFKDELISNHIFMLIKMLLICIAKERKVALRTLQSKYDHAKNLARYLTQINFPLNSFGESEREAYVQEIEGRDLTRKYKYDQMAILIYWNNYSLFLPPFFRVKFLLKPQIFSFDKAPRLKRGEVGNPSIPSEIFYALYKKSLLFVDNHSREIINSFQQEQAKPSIMLRNKLRFLVGACSVVLLSATGVRKNELLSMRDDCLVQYNDLFFVSFFESKINEENFLRPINEHIARSIYVLQEVKKLLNTKNDLPNDYLFGFKFSRKNSTPYLSKTEFRTIFERYMSFSGFKHHKITPHQFRSTFATNIYQKTSNENIAILLAFYALRHKKISMTLHYIKTNLILLKELLKDKENVVQDNRKFLGYTEPNYPLELNNGFYKQQNGDMILMPYCICLNFTKKCFFKRNFSTTYKQSLKKTKVLFNTPYNQSRCISLEELMDEKE